MIGRSERASLVRGRIVATGLACGVGLAGLAGVAGRASDAAPEPAIVLHLQPTSATAAPQDRVRPPRQEPGRVQPSRPGTAPRRLPPNRVQPDREAPRIDRPRTVESTRGPDADAADAGISRLATRLGRARPTGRGIAVALVEADEGGGRHQPDLAREEFGGITFVGAEPGDPSVHATMTAQRFFGDGPTAATGIDRVHLFSADAFLRDRGLKMGRPELPASLAGLRIISNSWVGDAGPASEEARQRIDVLAARDGILIVAGLPNSGPLQPLVGGGWNVLQVGTNDSGHSGDRDRAGDGTGGVRPRITAPGGATSAAAPVVSAAAAMLMEAAGNLELAAVPEAEREIVRRLAGRPEVVTAVLLAGARRENGYRGRWSDGSELVAAERTPADPSADPPADADASEPDDAIAARTTMPARRRSPLDPAVGAGALDVDASHRILSAGAVGPGLAAPPDGWSVLSPRQAEGVWVIDVTMPTTITANLVWYRTPVEGRGLVLPDLDLELLRVSPDDPRRAELVIASDARESSVEGLHVRIDEPGRYLLRVRDLVAEDRTGLAAVAWRMRPSRGPNEEGEAPAPRPRTR